ncbi:MAG: redoxin domain-containing protein [Candidatus Hydrogenedentes bacterium]|nr:redoxin domain-containing protein [Candidatus Hydrogenedentota bacterium]
MMCASFMATVLWFVSTQAPASGSDDSAGKEAASNVDQIMQRIKEFPFNPIRDGRTREPALDHDGVANLADGAWRVRVLAIRDLARLGAAAVPEVVEYLNDENPHVRHVAAFALGFHPGEASDKALIDLLRRDPDSVVRSQAVISLSQLKSQAALTLLEDLAQNDASRDVRHQCDLAAYRITKYPGPETGLAAAYARLDESKFEQIRVGQPALDFELADTDGNNWRLTDFRGKKSVVLIWIFADWCPVCHNEFRELIQLKEEYAAHNVEVVTIECHDAYRGRVMVGREFQPKYWFTKESPQGFYQGRIWWRHLVDPAGSVGATYGVQPMEFVVHSEWINRPATVIVDKEGIVQFAYYGTYWGDRPSIEQTLGMVRSGNFAFEHPKRLK